MIVDRIKYTQEFNILGEKIWAGMEASLQEGEDPIAASKEMAAMVNASHQSILFSDTVSSKERVIQKEKEMEPDAEFEAFKNKLSMFKYREEALAALDGSGYSIFNIEIKKILENLPVQSL